MRTSKRLPSTDEKKKHVMFALRPSQVAEVDACLGIRGISRSWLVEKLLDNWLEEKRGEK